MNKIKIITLLAMLCGFSSISFAAPTSFTVLTNKNKRVTVIGDLHPDTESKRAKEQAYFDVINRALNGASSNPQRTAWAIEALIDHAYISDLAALKKAGKIFDLLGYVAKKNGHRLNNIQFYELVHEKRCKLFGVITTFILSIAKLESEYLSVMREDLRVKKDILDKCRAWYMHLVGMNEKFPFIFQTFFDDLSLEIEELKASITRKKDSDVVAVFLRELLAEVEDVHSNLNKCYVKMKKLVPGCSDQLGLDAVYNVFKAAEESFDDVFDKFSSNIVFLMTHLGNINFAIQTIDLLNEHDDLTVCVGKFHADIITKLLLLIGFEKIRDANGSESQGDSPAYASARERIRRGEYVSDLDRAVLNLGIFSVPQFSALCTEWISNSPIISAGSEEVKAGGEAAIAAAGLRPAAPTSAALAAAAAAPNVAERKVMAEPEGAAATSTSPEKAASLSKICSACGKSGEEHKRCSRCKIAYYCTPACQAAHWPTHKLTCIAAKVK